jgi:hypothetical protein
MPLPSDPTWMKRFNTATGDPDKKVQAKLAKDMKLSYRSGVGCEIIGDLATYLVPHLCPSFCNGIFWYMRTCTLMVLKLQQESFLDSVRI